MEDKKAGAELGFKITKIAAAAITVLLFFCQRTVLAEEAGLPEASAKVKTEDSVPQGKKTPGETVAEAEKRWPKTKKTGFNFMFRRN